MDKNKLMWIIIGIILILTFAGVAIYLIYRKKPSFGQNVIAIEANTNPKSIDYIVVQNNKDVLSFGGIWWLDDIEVYYKVDNNKYDIINSGNKFTFKDPNKNNITIVRNNGCFDIVINNYYDEIKLCKNNFYRNNKKIAYISEIYKHRHILTINDNTDYIYIYCITFIIQSLINRSLTISLDKPIKHI